MKTSTHRLTFVVDVVKFGELNDYEQGSILRGFNDYMKSKAMEHNFLASGYAELRIETEEFK